MSREDTVQTIPPRFAANLSLSRTRDLPGPPSSYAA